MKLLVLTVLCCIALTSCVPDAHDNEKSKPASTQNEELLQDAPEVDETPTEMTEANTCLGRPSVFRLCENRQGTLRCPKGKVIVVAYANYGRTAKGVCRHNSIKTTRCYSSKSKILIRKACHGENKCALNARNSVYGDPCYGTYKYIEVLYHCV
ncbi:predicted protein [Nematostella vectensis]|uniref:SUEL-type lectin domain-containing protein n=1 Tax=Nematostella vectensis TaxID=45351 RepID=A7SLL8_NEMVE|nr:predicted protein [Nematostella vectensis]|eukprot:XP_001627471.1 predicted protein [Nematostella vectensis]